MSMILTPPGCLHCGLEHELDADGLCGSCSTQQSHEPVTAEILDACCGGRHWWWDKAHPLAVYMDKRVEPMGSCDVRPNWCCEPDLVGDFRAMPFPDDTFQLVLFDPPHIVRENASGYIVQKFGALEPDTEQTDLARGFAECWRVLRPGGSLVFKWAERLDRVEQHFPATPIVGTRSPRGGQTRWFIFYKPLEVA